MGGTDGGPVSGEPAGLRVLVDRARCQGYANCLDAAPDAFELDEHDIAVARADRFPAARRGELELAVRRCPAHALRLDELGGVG